MSDPVEVERNELGPPAEMAAYWRERAADKTPPLKPLGRACHDCAVVWGFYTPYSESLARQPAVVREDVSARWFCHNHADRACRGNIEYLRTHTTQREEG